MGDPKAVLDGIDIAGLVGVLHQLGELGSTLSPSPLPTCYFMNDQT